jgi:hypothetical protein
MLDEYLLGLDCGFAGQSLSRGWDGAAAVSDVCRSETARERRFDGD